MFKKLLIPTLLVSNVALSKEVAPEPKISEDKVIATGGLFVSTFGSRQYNASALLGLNLQVEHLYADSYVRPYMKFAEAKGGPEDQNIEGADYSYSMSTSTFGAGVILQNPSGSPRVTLGLEHESLSSTTTVSYQGEKERYVSNHSINYINLGLGNTWTIKNFVIGADWIEAKFPLGDASAYNVMKVESNQMALDTWLKHDAALVRWNFLKFKVGISF